MKKVFKKNQIIITALALMIAVAGYLQYTSSQDDSNLAKEASADTNEPTYEISDEDMEQASYSDIESMDSEVVLQEENYLDESMEEVLAENMTGDIAQNTENQLSEGETPGEAVFTSASSLNTLSGARLLKEQTRAKNKETLLEIINNVNISEEQKQEAVDNMIAITDIAEKETSAEILLESKGFDDVVVSITDETVDVVVNAAELSEAQRAQIEDIIVRKTGVTPDAIVISTLNEE